MDDDDNLLSVSVKLLTFGNPPLTSVSHYFLKIMAMAAEHVGLSLLPPSRPKRSAGFVEAFTAQLIWLNPP